MGVQATRIRLGTLLHRHMHWAPSHPLHPSIRCTICSAPPPRCLPTFDATCCRASTASTVYRPLAAPALQVVPPTPDSVGCTMHCSFISCQKSNIHLVCSQQYSASSAVIVKTYSIDTSTAFAALATLKTVQLAKSNYTRSSPNTDCSTYRRANVSNLVPKPKCTRRIVQQKRLERDGPNHRPRAPVAVASGRDRSQLVEWQTTHRARLLVSERECEFCSVENVWLSICFLSV